MGWSKKAAFRKLPAVFVFCAAACALVVIYSESAAKRRRASSSSLDFLAPSSKPISFLPNIVVDPNGAITFRRPLLSDSVLPESSTLVRRSAEAASPPESDDSAQELGSLLSVFADLMESLGLDYWITHGALLGSLISGTILPSPHNIHVAIPFVSMERLMVELNRPDFRLPCQDCRIMFRSDADAFAVPVRLENTTTGRYIDALTFLHVSFPRRLAVRDTDSPVKERDVSFPGVQSLWKEPCPACRNGMFNLEALAVYPLSHSCVIGERSYACPRLPLDYLKAWYSELSS